MVDLEKLWQYQQVDMELDAYEKEMRGNKNRKELVKYRNLLLEQQEALKKIESDVETMNDRIDALIDEVERLRKGVEDASSQLEANPPEDVEGARKALSTLQKLLDNITHYETEITKLKKDSDQRNQQQRKVRLVASKARAEFDRIKPIYDVEYKEASVHLEELKQKVEEAGKGIPADQLEHYKQIKRHCSPPITGMRDGNRCGGCNMQLPAADMNRIRTGTPYVECENCGRIILVQ